MRVESQSCVQLAVANNRRVMSRSGDVVLQDDESQPGVRTRTICTKTQIDFLRRILLCLLLTLSGLLPCVCIKSWKPDWCLRNTVFNFSITPLSAHGGTLAQSHRAGDTNTKPAKLFHDLTRGTKHATYIAYVSQILVASVTLIMSEIRMDRQVGRQTGSTDG